MLLEKLTKIKVLFLFWVITLSIELHPLTVLLERRRSPPGLRQRTPQSAASREQRPSSRQIALHSAAGKEQEQDVNKGTSHWSPRTKWMSTWTYFEAPSI
eukprot:865058-Pelagomonas_calceolata.AAC.3